MNNNQGKQMEWFTMENPFVQKQNMTLARGAFRQAQLNFQTEAVVAWLNTIFPGLNIPNSDAALVNALKDGIVLCDLLAKIAPETGVKKITSGKSDYIRLENVGAYLRAVSTVGVRNVFDAADLFEGRCGKVLSHLLELGEVAKKRGFRPCVGEQPHQAEPETVCSTPAPVQSTVVSASVTAAGASAGSASASSAPSYAGSASASVSGGVGYAEGAAYSSGSAFGEDELPETELDEQNLQAYEKASEEMHARIEEAKKEAAQEAERKRMAAEEETRQLKEELEKMRVEKEKLTRELNQTRSRKDEPAKLPFGNTEASKGDKDCFMAKYMEDGPPGRLTIIVVSIEGVAVLEPFSEEVIFSALWRRIKSWGINYTGDMFKLDYLPLKSTDGAIVPAWFACQNGSKLLDSIMKWISKKKEQLQEEQAEEAKNAAAGGAGTSLDRKPSLLKRMVGKGSK